MSVSAVVRSTRATRPRTLVRIAFLVLGCIAALSAARLLSGVDEVSGSGTIAASLRLAVPIAMAALSGLWSERAGVANLGIEGMMIAGTWFGAWMGVAHGVWVGVLAATVAGALFGLLHAVATVTFGVDQIVSGIAINLLAAGMARFLSAVVFSDMPGGGATQSPPVAGEIGAVTVPVLSGGQVFGIPTPDLLGAVERSGYFLVADIAGILRGLTTNVSWLTVIAIGLAVGTGWVLWRTAFGLRLRASGENPSAVDSLGVDVYRLKYIAVTVSGGLAGFAGAFLVMVSSDVYREGQTGGRGFIGLAAMIFGNWRPGGAGAAALLFGYADALQLRESSSVRTLILFAAILLALVAIWMLRRRRTRQSLLLATAGVAAFAIYQVTQTVAPQLVYATPYVVTLVVLAASSQRLAPPASIGIPYRRGE